MNIEPESQMRVALAKLELFFPYTHSLKEKRHIIHKIKDRIFAEFKVPVHEVDHHDKWQRAQLGLAVVGNDAIILNSIVDKIIAKIEDYGFGEMVDAMIEVVNF